MQNSAFAERPHVDLDQLNGKQKLIVEEVINHAQATLQGKPSAPILLNIDGTAGSRKSFLIDALSQGLENLEDQTNSMTLTDNPIVRRIAPTGVAAFNIGGATYFSALGLGPAVGKDGDTRSDSKFAVLQEECKGTLFVIIDEKSMVGRFVGVTRIT